MRHGPPVAFPPALVVALDAPQEVEDQVSEDQAVAPDVRVKFGPRSTQHMPIEWAEAMLTQLAADHANQFGKLLQAAALGTNGRRP
jgi:hypothetical protein